MTLSIIFCIMHLLDLVLNCIELIVCIPVCTNCSPLIADLLLICYGRDLMLSVIDNSQVMLLKCSSIFQDIPMTHGTLIILILSKW